MSKIFKDDEGTEILLDTGQNITAATTKQIKYKKPDGTTGAWVATVVSNTQLRYIAITGDFDIIGEYLLQAYIVLPSWQGHGDVAKLVVHELEI